MLLLLLLPLFRGHGTALYEGRLTATVCGVVQRINKLIYVQPVKSRWAADGFCHWGCRVFRILEDIMGACYHTARSAS
jgi:hypothetical protein